MSVWKEIVHDLIRCSDPIRKTTRPLLERFGVEYFTYHRIDRQGNYTVLLDRPDWAEQYVSEKFYEIDPYLRDPQVYRSGISLIEQHGSEAYRSAIMEAASKYQWDLGVMLIEKSEEGVEFFGFAGNRSRSSIDRIYLNQPALLKQFGRYFKTELASILSEFGQRTISLPEQKGKDFYCKEPIVPTMDPQAHRAFLADLGLKKELALADSLTNQERRCLQLLLQGSTAKEMAFSMELSPRTVEFYLENLKNKFRCSNKGELFLVAKRLSELGLLY